jgi:hypothetical protein
LRNRGPFSKKPQLEPLTDERRAEIEAKIDKLPQIVADLKAATEDMNRLLKEIEELLQKFAPGIEASIVIATDLDTDLRTQDVTQQVLLVYANGLWIDRGKGREPVLSLSRDLRWRALDWMPYLLEAVCDAGASLQGKTPKTIERAKKLSAMLQSILDEDV